MNDTCPACEAMHPADARYCPECGATLAPETGEDAGRSIAAITHVLGLLTWIVGPLVVLIVTNNAFVRENAKNALMWQLMLTIYGIISAILILVLVGIFLVFVLLFLDLIFCIIAAIKASEGETWTYPLTPTI